MKKPACTDCTHYSAYYKQWSSCFGRLNNGFCSNHKIPKTQFDVCEDFVSNEKKERMREKRRLAKLDEALQSIIEIAAILKEKQNDT